MKKKLNEIFDEAKPQELDIFSDELNAPKIPDDVLASIKGKVYAKTKLKKNNNKNLWLRFGAIAACFIAVVAATALIIPMFNSEAPAPIIGTEPDYEGAIHRDYKGVIGESELAIVFPWEYKLTHEKFYKVTYNENNYYARRAINESLLGEIIGTCRAEGADIYTNKTYNETFNVRKIKGVSEEKLIAVEMDNGYYVYFNDEAKCPATFGELLDAYNLSKTLSLVKFSVNEGYNEKGYYQITNDGYIWQVLSECRDAELYAENNKWNRGDRNYLSFTSTSEELGVYKKAFYITEDGYVSTNVFDYSCVYYIGEDAANKIIAHAKNNAAKAEREQYEYIIAGTVTEIGDGYILLDDTALCRDENDGMVFKVLSEELIIRRYLECSNIKVGDIVVVNFQTEIILGENNTVSGAISMYKGKVMDSGDIAVPE